MLSWAAFAIFLVLIDVGLSSRKTPQVDQSFLFFALILISIIPLAALAYRGSFESRRWQNSNVSPPPSRASSWQGAFAGGSFGGDSDD